MNPLSFAQARLWFLDQLEPGNYARNSFYSIEFEGELQHQVFARALVEILHRHATLRTAFIVADGVPRQLVATAEQAPELLQRALVVVDLRSIPSKDRRQQLEALATEDARFPFDLTCAPLLLVKLVRTGERRHTVFITCHDIVADAWSFGLFFHELNVLYRSFHAGELSPLEPLPIQYMEFVRWQQEDLDLAPQLDYWRGELEGAPVVLNLPTDGPRPPIASARGAIHPFSLPGPLHQRLTEFARQAGATSFMVLLAAFDALLYRYTGQKDLLVGTSIANRQRAELEGLIGCFSNTLVLRAQIDEHITFRQLLEQIRSRALGAYAHQDLPFERLLEEIPVPRDASRNPLFQVGFNLLNTSTPSLELPGLTVRACKVDRHLPMVDLTLVIFEVRNGFDGYIEFNIDLFEPVTIGRLAEYFQVLLVAVLNQPDRSINRQPWLGETEYRRVVAVWSRGGGGKPVSEPIHRLIARRAEMTPDAVAVIDSAIEAADGALERSLSFCQLVNQAQRVARVLRQLGVGPESRVGISMERSLEAVIAILGTLEVGAAYVSLDPTYPEERRKNTAADAGVQMIITRKSILEYLSDPTVEREKGPAVALENTAYVVYTSGSTGTPRGVMVPHRAVSHHASTIACRYRLGAGDRVLQFASLAFDVSVEELFPTLLSGAALVLRPSNLPLAVSEFLHFVKERHLSVLNLPTHYWHEWMSELSGESLDELPKALRLVIVGTEQALPDRLQTWLSAVGDSRIGRKLNWINSYGASEATVTSTVYGVEPFEAGEYSDSAGDGEIPTDILELQHVPIGKPIANVSAYVLNNHLALVPPKVSGCLYLGGVSLARGYQGQAALTARRFLPDAYTVDPGSRIFKTGDISRWLADGNIEFLGRSDQQIKIRGFRIELGEIEVALSEHPALSEVAVIGRQDQPGGDRQLVAYVVPEPEGAEGEANSADKIMAEPLRRYLRARLPEYMIPSHFVSLERWPITANGKLDRAALPAPAARRLGGEGSKASATEMGRTIAGIWREVLGIDEIGIQENFFDLGGHSLDVVRVHSKLSQIVESELPVIRLFENPTIESLSEYLENAVVAGTTASEGQNRAAARIRAARRRHLRARRKSLES